MSLSGRVWPTPPLIHCICLRVIPHPHLFNFTRQTFFWCVSTSFPYDLNHTWPVFWQGGNWWFWSVFGGEGILGQRRNTEQDYCTTFIIFYVWAFISGLERLQSQAFFFYGTFKKLICLYREGHPSAKWFMKMWYSCIFLSLSET